MLGRFCCKSMFGDDLLLDISYIEYIEYNISKSSEHKRNLIKEGFLSVPVMKIDEDYVLGFDVPRIKQLLNI